MNIGSVIERAARIMWKHKVLAALGILDIILTSSGLLERVFDGWIGEVIGPSLESQDLPFFKLPPPLIPLDQAREAARWLLSYGPAGWIGPLVAFIVVLIILAVCGL